MRQVMSTISFRFGRNKCADELSGNSSNLSEAEERRSCWSVVSINRVVTERWQIQNPRRQPWRKVYRHNSGRIRCDSLYRIGCLWQIELTYCTKCGKKITKWFETWYAQGNCSCLSVENKTTRTRDEVY